MAKKKTKTNVMRLLDQHKIPYETYEWEQSMPSNQDIINKPIYKTLVTVGKSGEHYVFVVPIKDSLHLKKAAKAVDEKNIQMIKEKDLIPLTGYVHGGCSPIGMKKELLTTIDQTATHYDHIIVSAGQVGVSVGLDPQKLAEFVQVQFKDIRTEEV